MASAAPQKRMVSSVFITLASPHRATVTPSTHTTNTHTATRVSSKDSAPGALLQGVRSDTRHTHSTPPRDAASTGSHTPTTPSSSIPPSPTHTLLSPGTRAAPPPPVSSSRSPASWTKETVPGTRISEEYLPPPPPPSSPPPSQDAELCADLTSPLPPPPVFEQSADPSLSLSPGDPPQSITEMSHASAWKPEERAPPGGVKQDKMVQSVQPNQEEEIDQDSKDACGFCRKPVALTEPAIEALNRTYHASCFQCRQCQTALAGQLYYNKAGIPLCEDCYLASLEQCWACGEPIKDHVIRALGRAYHPPCFVCTTCNRPIGEERFAQGDVGEVYCLPDYYRKYAPQCSVCNQLIVPGEDGRDSFTVECLGRSFHEDCYRCEAKLVDLLQAATTADVRGEEDVHVSPLVHVTPALQPLFTLQTHHQAYCQVCSILLSTEPNEQGCFPLDGQILCKPCHLTLVQEGHR